MTKAKEINTSKDRNKIKKRVSNNKRQLTSNNCESSETLSKEWVSTLHDLVPLITFDCI